MDNNLKYSDEFKCTMSFAQILFQLYDKFKSNYVDFNDACCYIALAGKNQENNFTEIPPQAWDDSAVIYDQLQVHFHKKPSMKIVERINSL